MPFKKTYPSTYRIDDWENPWLPLPVRLFNSLPENWIEKFSAFDEDKILSAAQKSTGLNDFGDDDFLEPFRILLDDLTHHNDFANLGRLSVLSILHMQLTSRLRLQDRMNHQPEALQQDVKSPIIIAGLPRTGTTHLHNLLACSQSLRYIPLWQTFEPAQSWQEIQSKQKDKRQQRTSLKMATADYMIPLFKRMHDMTNIHTPEEELTICALSYRSFVFEGGFHVPHYRQWYSENEHSIGYEYLKKVLQILQTEPAPGKPNLNTSQNPEDLRWILKSPQHVDQLNTILEVFPDAKIVLTHRDPVKAVLSLITMLLYTNRQNAKKLTQKELKKRASHWVERLAQMLERSQQQAKNIPAKNLMHVNFDSFIHNQEDTVKQVLNFSEVELDKVSEQAIDTHLKNHTRDKHGRIDYRFEDLGLNEDAVRERFNFYKKHP